MTHYFVKLRFTSPVRFGADSSGIGIEEAQAFIHSDTLFSALCNAWIKFNILKASELESAGDSISLSSTSFFSNNFNGSPTYFLPKPKIPCVWLENYMGDNKKELEKILKKAQWIPTKMFEHWLNPKPPANVFENKSDKLSKALAYGSLYQEQVVAKHAQDRLTSASNLFHQTQYQFKQTDSGLYFFVSFGDNETEEEYKTKFNEGLKALSQTGLGGERNFGLGRFEVKTGFGELLSVENSDLSFLFQQNPQSNALQCLLSLSLPIDAEINNLQNATEKQKVFYDLTPRKGWTFSSANLYQMKRQTISMFSEGSVFENDLCPKGTIANVAPIDSNKQVDFPHSVYRYGKSFTVPLKTY